LRFSNRSFTWKVSPRFGHESAIRNQTAGPPILEVPTTRRSARPDGNPRELGFYSLLLECWSGRSTGRRGRGRGGGDFRPIRRCFFQPRKTAKKRRVRVSTFWASASRSDGSRLRPPPSSLQQATCSKHGRSRIEHLDRASRITPSPGNRHSFLLYQSENSTHVVGSSCLLHRV